MAMMLDADTVTHGIQLAVAPVFLLTAVSGLIGAIAGRLARIIDRARVVEDRARLSDDAEYLQRARNELMALRQRGRLANGGIALLTLESAHLQLSKDCTRGQWRSWVLANSRNRLFDFPDFNTHCLHVAD